MTTLTKPLRRQLETTIKQAREIAEDAAREAIARMGVAEAEAPTHLSDDNKALRRRLRAHARTLGDTRDAAGAMSTARLQDAASYEIWHRMLFGRFLAERGLLIHPELGAAMSVTELRDLAEEEGAADEWALAERYAAPGLPGVFKPDDPVLALPIAPEFSKRPRAVLSNLGEEVFTADDSLGWTYQFWRASEKEAVNAAEGKIGAAELPAVTQLFTEPYMVKFLLHNTLGAWWAGKVLALDKDLARNALNEAALRERCALPGVAWEFLRFMRDCNGDGSWKPAGGTFGHWPVRAAEITYCDPCCGSGHFLVEAFRILAALRRQEEGITDKEAAVAVLRDNLHGLELDGRCVQIATFNVALSAWSFAGAPIQLPIPDIAWIGARPPLSRSEMAGLGSEDPALRGALESLYDRFVDAPLLGSLLTIDARDLQDADLRTRGTSALASLRTTEAEVEEGVIAAKGLFAAATLLARRFVLVATNVPFLGRAKQEPILANYIAKHMPEARADLATAMLLRLCAMISQTGTVAAVTPQTWLTLGAYSRLRKLILSEHQIELICDLGPAAFQEMNWWAARTALIVLGNLPPGTGSYFAIDADTGRDLEKKPALLSDKDFQVLSQADQAKNPDYRITVYARSDLPLLSKFAHGVHGLGSKDTNYFFHRFWEIPLIGEDWELLQTTVESTRDFGGMEQIVFWQKGNGILHDRGKRGEAVLAGGMAWGKVGVLISQMRHLPATRYVGNIFDKNTAVILPHDARDLPAIWAFCSAPEFHEAVRRIDQKVYVTNNTLVKVPFDIAHWKNVAESKYKHGIPQPYSDDPTQWIFHGHPAFAEDGTQLHVALAGLAGYRWPAQYDPNIEVSERARERIEMAAKLPYARFDALFPVHSVGIDMPLADRLRQVLAAAYRKPLTPAEEGSLVRVADAKIDKREARDLTLEGWLADRAFRQHCILFQQRPFLFQIWDGIKGGFSVFLNYHQLDRGALDKLTYTLLGDWIRTAKAEGNTARLERGEQLQQKLVKIIEGDSPFDIFVRWKRLAMLPLGWDPDLNDGVRLNIRPFMTAGILREQPKGISWNEDRGTDALSAPWYDLGPRYGGKPGDRINDHHTTLAEKRAARGTS